LKFCPAWPPNQPWSGIWHGAPDRILIDQPYPARKTTGYFHCILEAPETKGYSRPRQAAVRRLFQIASELLHDRTWRELACRHGLGGLYLVALAQRHETFDPRPLGFDALAVSNHSRVLESRRRGGRRKLDGTFEPRAVFFQREILRRVPNLFLYEDAMRYFLWDAATAFPCFPCVVPGWDSSPRSGSRALILHGETPALFERHVRDAMKQVAANDPEEQILYKSWNEWEGNYSSPMNGGAEPSRGGEAAGREQPE
jgi:hypothetical protein